jgi:hypothetical protein
MLSTVLLTGIIAISVGDFNKKKNIRCLSTIKTSEKGKREIR